MAALAEVAESDPHSSYCAFTFGLIHKWSYFQRTIPSSPETYAPLEDAIRTALLPKILGRGISDTERELISLPCKLGGLGIPNPTETAEVAYQDSKHITQPLTALICEGRTWLDACAIEEASKRQRVTERKNEEQAKAKQQELILRLPDHLRRLTRLNSEKGSSSWLTTLPIVDFGFYLNKQSFIDAMCLRYGWRIKGMPSSCACGTQNSINHALNCKKGGFVSKRHNEIRDIEAEMLSEVCSPVQTEPQLLPITGEDVRGNQAEEARLDIAAVGLWGPQELSFMDVRIFNPNCDSYRDKTPADVYTLHENEKKNAYNGRVINVERGTFTPLIFSTSGGWGREATAYHSRLAKLIAEKRKESSSQHYSRRNLHKTQEQKRMQNTSRSACSFGRIKISRG